MCSSTPCSSWSDCESNEFCGWVGGPQNGECLPCYLDENLLCWCGQLRADQETCGCDVEITADSETEGFVECLCNGDVSPMEACAPVI